MNHDDVNYQISEDQNFLTIEGEQYQAVDAIPDRDHCANCVLYTRKINPKCDLSLVKGFCVSRARKDKRAIIWARKEVAE